MTSPVPGGLRYTKTHEWLRVEGAEAVVGITAYAQQELTDIVFVELPQLDAAVTQGAACVVVESVKAASEIFAPVSGVVIGVNQELTAHPEFINQDPYGRGWIVRMRMKDPRELEWLLTDGAYADLIGVEQD